MCQISGMSNLAIGQLPDTVGTAMSFCYYATIAHSQNFQQPHPSVYLDMHSARVSIYVSYLSLVLRALLPNIVCTVRSGYRARWHTSFIMSQAEPTPAQEAALVSAKFYEM